jgi:hypothetical protein
MNESKKQAVGAMSKVVIDAEAIIQSSYLSYAIALTICHTVTEILELIPPQGSFIHCYLRQFDRV